MSVVETPENTEHEAIDQPTTTFIYTTSDSQIFREFVIPHRHPAVLDFPTKAGSVPPKKDCQGPIKIPTILDKVATPNGLLYYSTYCSDCGEKGLRVAVSMRKFDDLRSGLPTDYTEGIKASDTANMYILCEKAKSRTNQSINPKYKVLNKIPLRWRLVFPCQDQLFTWSKNGQQPCSCLEVFTVEYHALSPNPVLPREWSKGVIIECRQGHRQNFSPRAVGSLYQSPPSVARNFRELILSQTLG